MKIDWKRGKQVLAQAWTLLARDERGQVGDAGMVGGESDSSEDSSEASFDRLDPDDDTTGATVFEAVEPPQQLQQVAPPAVESKEESFIDPASLPPELKSHWTRMHRSYTQALEGVKGVQEKASAIDRFYQDPQFATQTFGDWAQRNPQAAIQAVRQWGQANGVEFVAAGQQQGQQQPQQDAVPAQIVDAMRQQLKATTPELEWMAPSLAPAMWAAIQQAVAPIAQFQMQQHQGQQAQQQAAAQQAQQAHYGQQQQAYEQLAKGLTEAHPGWQEHEAAMTEILGFLVSPELNHPTYGSKIELLFNLATGGTAATQRAVRRMNDATRLRGGSGSVGRSATANIADRVRGASTRSDAFRIAGEAALAQLGQ